MDNVKILCLVTPDIVSSVRRVASSFDNVVVHIKTYQDPGEVVDLVASGGFNVILFGGPLAYNIAKENIRRRWLNLEVPVLYIDYTEVSIYKALFDSIDLASIAKGLRFSIDHPAEADIKECLEELEIRSEQIFSWECTYTDKLDDIARFHYGLWKRGQVDFSMTSVYLIYEKLKGMGAPVVRIVPAKSSIRSGMQRAILMCQAKAASKEEMAVLKARMADFPSGEERETRNTIAQEDINQLIQDFSIKVKGEMRWEKNRSGVEIICRKQDVDKVTNVLDEFDVGYRIYNKCGVGSFWGVGYGSSVRQAARQADVALKASIRHGKYSCHIADTDGHLLGPVGQWEKAIFAYRTDNDYILELSRKTGLGVGSIHKIISLSSRGNELKVTANDVAKRFNISSRSARRIIASLEKAGYATVIGEEQLMGKGRPRRLYLLRM
ncbi:HTH domain-containing protein [Halomonas kalidii]|uniref:Helix-turn-helix type 11 domain-containing protein n=1 Tax=Halomonas kalidii TaxID=3043293 RepID=A0ABT6VI49_9GAMM|nr:HTH domain-containing protein [Halomonas kalidii]MDI5933650.1 hypothetical protein [Halomonas kalidii]